MFTEAQDDVVPTECLKRAGVIQTGQIIDRVVEVHVVIVEAVHKRPNIERAAEGNQLSEGPRIHF